MRRSGRFAPGEDPAIDAPPLRTAVFQNVPNPFNPTTTIRFDLARDGRVQLRIYDVAGRHVRTLLDEGMTAGAGKLAIWNGLDDTGNHVSSGVYFYRFEAGDFAATKKLVVMK